MSETSPRPEDLAAAEAARTAEVLQLEAGVAEKALHGEDRALADEENRLYGAIDGMGGHFGGATAAQEVHDAAESYMTAHRGEFTPDNGADMMRGLFSASIDAVKTRAETDTRLEEMGAVAAIGHFFEHDGKSYIAVGVIGDAKFVLKHAGEEKVVQSTDECMDPPNANVVTNCISPKFNTQLNQFKVFEVKDGDRVAFLTDGITGDDPEDKLRPGEGKYALSLPTAQESADELLRVSLDRKWDDKTAVVVRATVRSTESETPKPEPEVRRKPSPADVADSVMARKRRAAEAAAPAETIEPVAADRSTTAEEETEPLSDEAAAALARLERAFAPDGDSDDEAELSSDGHEGEVPAETISRLEAENARLHTRITELEGRIDRLTGEITALREALTAAGVVDPTRVRGPEPVPPVPDDDPEERRRRRDDRERYEAPKADPDAVDIFTNVRAQEVRRVQVLLDKWQADGLIRDADTMAAMRADMLRGAYETAAAASVAAGGARRDAHSPARDRELLARDRRIAELEHELESIDGRRRDRDGEDDHDDGDDSDTPGARRREAVERFMAPESEEEEELDVSESGLRSRIRRIFSRGRDEEGEEGDADADPEAARARIRERAVRRFLVPMAVAGAIYAGTLRPGEPTPRR